MSDEMRAGTVEIPGQNGDPIEAYFAEPTGPGSYGSVIVIHHLPGYDDATKEIAPRKFAANGYLAICPNLYSRQAPDLGVDEASAKIRELGGVHDEQLVGDVEGAKAFLQSQPSSNGKVGTIGYCSGGRQSFLAACNVDLDAAVVCYGGWIAGEAPEGFPQPGGPLLDAAANISCPILGLFGIEDQSPSPSHVEEIEKALIGHGKDFEFHSYENAGHGFFGVDRPSYRVDAANEGWKEIWDFYGRYLAS